MQPLEFSDQSSHLVLDNCTFGVRDKGLQLTKGTVFCNRHVILDISSTSTENGLMFGDGTEAGDIQLEMYAGATLDFQQGHITYNTVSDQGFRAKSKFTKFKRSANSTFYLKQNLLLTDLTIEADPLAVSIADSNKWIKYNNVTFVWDDGENQSEFLANSYAFIGTGHLLDGNQSIWLDVRSLPVPVYISGTGNRISGDGSIREPITLLDSNAELNLSIGGFLVGGIVLNGGILRLEAPMKCGKPFGPGRVDLSCFRIEFCPQDITWDKSICWNGNNACLMFNSDIKLTTTWAFCGACTICGNGNSLEFAEGGSINLSGGSHITFKDITLKNIVDGSLTVSCSPDLTLTCSGFDSCFTCTPCDLSYSGTYTCSIDALITLDDVYWIQAEDVNFTDGAFEFRNNIKMQGEATLSYLTTGTSTITTNSRLKLSDGFRFDYNPKDGSQELLKFEDETSMLVLNGATVHAGLMGLVLKKGVLRIDDHSHLSSELHPVTLGEGISLGDGNPENDLACEIDSGVTLEIIQGYLKYKNVDPSSWKMLSCYSQLVMGDNTVLYLYENLNIGRAKVVFGANTMLYRVPGKAIIGGISVVGSLGYGSLQV